MSSLDALESSAGEVFRRLNMDTLAERTAQLKSQQQLLQDEMARRNEEYKQRRPAHSPSRPDLLSSLSSVGRADGRHSPARPGGGGRRSPTRGARDVQGADHLPPHLQQAQAQTRGRAGSPSSATYARATEALQKARKARAVPTPEPVVTPARELSSPRGAMLERGGVSPQVHSRGISPARGTPGQNDTSVTLSSVSSAYLGKPGHSGRQPVAVLESSYHAPSSLGAQLPSLSLSPGRPLQAIPTPVLPSETSTRAPSPVQPPPVMTPKLESTATYPQLSQDASVAPHHNAKPATLSRDALRKQAADGSTTTGIRTPPTPASHTPSSRLPHAAGSPVRPPNTTDTIPVQAPVHTLDDTELQQQQHHPASHPPSHPASSGAGLPASLHDPSAHPDPSLRSSLLSASAAAATATGGPASAQAHASHAPHAPPPPGSTLPSGTTASHPSLGDSSQQQLHALQQQQPHSLQLSTGGGGSGTADALSLPLTVDPPPVSLNIPSVTRHDTPFGSTPGSVASAQQWTPTPDQSPAGLPAVHPSEGGRLPDDGSERGPVTEQSQALREREETHREEMRLAYEIHAKQQQRIQEMEELLQQVQADQVRMPSEPAGGGVGGPAESAVIDELRKIQEQNSAITERLSQQVDALRSTSPSRATPHTPGSPGSSRRGSQAHHHDSRAGSKRKPANLSPTPTSWSPSTLRVGEKVDRHMRRPSDFLLGPDTPSCSDSDEGDEGYGGGSLHFPPRGGRAAGGLQQQQQHHRRQQQQHRESRRGSNSNYSVDNFSYTKNALRRGRSASVGGRRRGDGGHKYAFGSTLRIKIEPAASRSASLRSSARAASLHEAPRGVGGRGGTGVSPPPNRHRLGSSIGRQSSAASTQAAARRRGGSDAGGGWLRRDGGGAAVAPSRGSRHGSPEGSATQAGGSRRGSVSPQGDGGAAPEGLQVPLPECCSALALSDAGVSPRGLVQIAHLHLQAVVSHYLGWLRPTSSPEAMEEAAAILSILPLASLPMQGFASTLQAVLTLLGQRGEIPRGVVLYLLRVLQVLSAARSNEHLPEWSHVFKMLVGLMREEDFVSLMPNIIAILLAFGTRGLSVLLKEAAAEPPAHDISPMEDGGVSGFNSCLLTLIANQPAVVRSVVVPLVIRDLRDGTPERAEAACNALIGLHKHKPQVLGQLGEALVSGKIDRRVACMAVRVIGGADGVSLLQSLLGHQSHRVRQSAAWGLGLHAPEEEGCNPEFDFLPTEHVPRPAFEKLHARCTSVVHAELPALDIIQSPPTRLPPPILYFQPQLAPECPPYTETHIIVDASVLLQQCSDFIRNHEIDFSVGQAHARLLPADDDINVPVRPRFMEAAKRLALMSEDDARHMTLFLGTFRPITEGRGVLSGPFVQWQRTLRMPAQVCCAAAGVRHDTLRQGVPTPLPQVTRPVLSRIVGSLVTVASAGGDTPQDMKVKGEALHVLRWFPADLVEPSMKHLRAALHGPHPALRSGVVVLLSELVRKGQERGAVSDIVGLLSNKLNDPHPRVRLACVVALRSTQLPSTLLDSLLRYLRDGKINRYQVAHTVACVVPKGVQALVDASLAQSIEAGTRKASMYGLGKIHAEHLHLDHPKLNEAVSQCLAQGCSEGNTAEVREQALLSLACFSSLLANPLSPPCPADNRENDLLSISDLQRKAVLVSDTAVGVLHSDDPRLRRTAATVLALCGKRGVCSLQETILKPRAALAAVRLSAVSALPHIANKATMFRTALIATSDADADVRQEALDVMFSSPIEVIADDLRRLPPPALDEVRNAALDLLNRSRHVLPPATLTSLHTLVELL